MFVSFIFFVKQKTAYEVRISDWSSDVCSSELRPRNGQRVAPAWGRSHRSGSHARLSRGGRSAGGQGSAKGIRQTGLDHPYGRQDRRGQVVRKIGDGAVGRFVRSRSEAGGGSAYRINRPCSQHARVGRR